MKPHSKLEKLIFNTLGTIMLLEFLDVSILNTSLPQIAFNFQVNPIYLKIVLTIYLLTLGAFLPTTGWFSERFGTKKVLLVSITGFLLSSMLCGLSVNLLMLTISRALQGMFAAFVSPCARIYILQHFRERRGEIFAKIAVIFLLGPLLGPLIGGAITTYLNWRFVFFVNLPLGLVILFIMAKYFPGAEKTHSRRFDFIGFVMLAVALVSWLFVTDTLLTNSVPNNYKTTAGIVGLVLFIAYYLHYRKSNAPLINLKVFTLPFYRYFLWLLTGFRLFAAYMGFLLPLYAQTQLGYTAFQAGLMMAPLVLGAMLAKSIFKKLIAALTARQLYTFLFGLPIIVQILQGWIFLHFNLTAFIILSIIQGTTISMFMSCNSIFLYHDLTGKLINDGSVLSTTSVQLASAFAIAIVATVLLLTSGMPDLAWHEALPKSSYAMVMFISSALLAFMLISIWLMPKQIRKEKLTA